jgi:drug/metabolite transporter (DMT)-like permease
VFLVSSAGLFAHQALAEATPLAIAAWRLGLAALFFGGLSLLPRGEAQAGTLPPHARRRLLLAGLCLAGHFVTWFAALDRTSVARATLLACTTPLWTTLGSFLLGRRRPTLRDLAALAVAGLGLWLVTQASAQTASRASLLGDAFGLSAGLLFGSYLLCVEGLHGTVSSQRQVTLAYSVAAVLLWAVLLVRGGATLSYSPRVWKALLGMTLGPQIFGHTLLNWSLRHFSSSLVAFSILLEPVIAALLAWYLLGQTLTAVQLMGGVLVLAALALVIGQKTPAERVETEAVG